MKTGSFEKDGKKVFTMEVIADEVRFLEPNKKVSGENNRSNNSSYQNNNGYPQNEDPFINSGTEIDNGEWPFG